MLAAWVRARDPIERGFLVSTGYFTELAPGLDDWHANGVITSAQHQALKTGN